LGTLKLAFLLESSSKPEEDAFRLANVSFNIKKQTDCQNETALASIVLNPFSPAINLLFYVMYAPMSAVALSRKPVCSLARCYLFRSSLSWASGCFLADLKWHPSSCIRLSCSIRSLSSHSRTLDSFLSSSCLENGSREFSEIFCEHCLS